MKDTDIEVIDEMCPNGIIEHKYGVFRGLKTSHARLVPGVDGKLTCPECGYVKP